MTALTLILASFRRHRTRTAFTVLSVATAFAIFALLAAIKTGLSGGLNYIQAQRLLTINRLLNGGTLPIRYGDKIRNVPGVVVVAASKQLAGYFRAPSNPIDVQMFTREVLRVYPEFHFDGPGQSQAFMTDRRGVVAGAAIAARQGWKVGQDIPIQGGPVQSNGSKTWLFHLDGIYGRSLPVGYQNLVIGHFGYYNDSVADPALKDRVYQFDIRINDAHALSRTAHAIDTLFTDSTPQTITVSEQELVLSAVNEFGDIGTILLSVGAAVFFTMLLITANTMANSVRERMGQFAMMRALGFSRWHLARIVLAETAAMIAPGAVLGLALGWGLCRAMAPYISWALQAFSLTGTAVAAAAGLAGLFILISGIGPGWRVSRLRVATALRRG